MLQDLANDGPEGPWNMSALCPNCHALKTPCRSGHRLDWLIQHVSTGVRGDSTGRARAWGGIPPWGRSESPREWPRTSESW
jgi:hypothetical protein